MSALTQLLPLTANLAPRQCHVVSPTARRRRPISNRSRSVLRYSRIEQRGVRMSASSSNLDSFTDSSSQLKDELLKYSRAFWVSESLIAWNPVVGVEASDGYSCYLYASKTAAISANDGGISGFDEKIELHEHISGLPQKVVEKFPHIRDYKVFQVPPSANCRSLVKCQLVIAAFGSNENCKDATGLQLPGVLDELFSYDGPLGAHYSDDIISLFLWAPTAQSVRAWIYDDAKSADPLEIVSLHEFDGVWTVNGSSDWNGCYYAYEVHVYHPSTLAVEKCFVSDPYARGLSPNCQRTLFVNLADDDLAPDGWHTLAERKPTLSSFTDISIYELHVRDFSADDQTVHPDIRGGYLAFTVKNSAGMLHLQQLSQAGITHVHLLPSFQFAGVDDVKENWLSVDEKQLGSFPPDSTEQQALITKVQDNDGYNWGYNPVLWGVPKGSYASDSNGTCRVIEFRKMVQSLNECGIRVILDVVYNHIHGSGPFDQNSILDKIVPGYYLRRNVYGHIENSTCVNNTASEHYMVERLIIDDLVNWAVNYKVDGFRFDLMGHIMKRTMVKARGILRNLTNEKDQVDGSTIYIYGEGWDFGEVANNGRGINASQFNISGTGIGSFNDRIRDAMLGGSPFGHPLQQGFVTGLLLQPNGHDHGGKDNEKSMLSSAKDNIQVGMAANLRDFVFTNKDGNAVKGGEVFAYGDVPVAYASSPTETINYVSAHDNETLFDVVSMKTPMSLSVDERCRINHLASSIIALSQGIPFFHAGDELLRSKSLDRDSYNSGDWFNRLDFSYSSNNWGVGLPPYQKNKHNWNLIKPRLADPSFKPQKHQIVSALQKFLNMLEIRYSSPLFRLPTYNSIQERVRFHNAGPSWVPGVIVMSIEDGYAGVPGLSQLDPMYSYVVVIFNCGPTEVCFGVPAFRGKELELHPVQSAGADAVVKASRFESVSGSFYVPALTASVFVSLRN